MADIFDIAVAKALSGGGGSGGGNEYVVTAQLARDQQTDNWIVESVDKTVAEIYEAYTNEKRVIAKCIIEGAPFYLSLIRAWYEEYEGGHYGSADFSLISAGMYGTHVELTVLSLDMESAQDESAEFNLTPVEIGGTPEQPFLFVSEIFNSSNNTVTLDATWNTIHTAMLNDKIVYIKGYSPSGSIVRRPILEVFSGNNYYYVDSAGVTDDDWHRYTAASENDYPSRTLPQQET